MFRVIHNALRRDADRLVRAAQHATSAADVRAVAEWFAKITSSVDSHHRTEDDIWWPMLERSVGGFPVAPELVAEHQRLVDATDRVTAALDRDGELLPAAVLWAKVLIDHLEHEEAVVFPALEAADLAAVDAAERASAREDSLRTVAFALPWVLDELADPDRSAVLADLPAPLRWLLGRWTRRYGRLTRPVCALAAGRSSDHATVVATTDIRRPAELVRSHFGDPAYHQRYRVHADVTFTVLAHEGDVWRCRQETRLRPVGRLRQTVELRPSAGGVETTVVDGPLSGSRLRFDFEAAGTATRVTASVDAELGALWFLRPLIDRSTQRALERALEEDKRDLESGRYERHLADSR